MRLGDFSDDGEAEPGPLPVGRVSRLEHPFALVAGNAGAVVGDVEPPGAVADGHGRPPVVDGVGEEVLQQLLEATAVGSDRPLGLDDEGHVTRDGGVPALGRERRDVDGSGGVPDAFALSSERQEVFDQRLAPSNRARRGREVLTGAHFHREFEPAVGDAQRVPQVV